MTWKVWTEEEDNAVIDLWGKGKSVKQIAKALNRSPAATATRVSDLRKSRGDNVLHYRGNSPGAPLKNKNGEGKGEPVVPSPFHALPAKMPDNKNWENFVNSLFEQQRAARKEREAKAEAKAEARDEFCAQLERENKALIAALDAVYALIQVYTRRQ